jgi:hypothetical protein
MLRKRDPGVVGISDDETIGQAQIPAAAKLKLSKLDELYYHGWMSTDHETFKFVLWEALRCMVRAVGTEAADEKKLVVYAI